MNPLRSSARTVDLGAIADPMAQQALAYCRQPPGVALLVGGSVRDLLLGRATHDLDFVVPQHAMALARRLADALGGAFVPVDPERDIGRAVVTSPTAQSLVVDVAAWRAGSLEEDLRLRDFTINALALPVDRPDPVVIDVCGGLDDLDRGLLRVSSAAALRDDPLRMLRAVRLLAELAPWAFRLEADTARQIRLDAPMVVSCSAERIRDELVRILASGQPDRWVQELADLSLLEPVLPEMSALRGVAQTSPHQWDVFEHTLRTIAYAAWLRAWMVNETEPVDEGQAALAEVLAPYRGRLASHFAADDAVALRNKAHLLVWAALCHDWGKPATYAVERAGPGQAFRVQFIGHERHGATLTQHALRRLRFSEDAVRRTSTVVAHHMRPLWLAAEAQQPSDRAIFRYFKDLGDAGVDVAVLSLCDVLASSSASYATATWVHSARVVAWLLHSYFDRPGEAVAPPAVIDGTGLMAAFGLAPGRLIGQLLAAVAEAQAAGEVYSAQEALDYAGQLIPHLVEENYGAAAAHALGAQP